MIEVAVNLSTWKGICLEFLKNSYIKWEVPPVLQLVGFNLMSIECGYEFLPSNPKLDSKHFYDFTLTL